MHVFLVRHGEYAADEAGDEQLGQGLTATGMERALAAGEALRTLVPNIEALEIVSSDLKRASDTAHCIAERLGYCLPLRTTPALREISDQHPSDRLRPAARVDRFFGGFRAEGQEGASVICVCHANVIRYALVTVGGLGRPEWESLQLEYCSVSALRLSPTKGAQIIFKGKSSGVRSFDGDA
jgi:serine/threonine-protein phosphatase PGAM5